MGKQASKIEDIPQLEGDVKQMAIQGGLQCVQHRHVWKKDFGFDGQLKIEATTALLQKIRFKTCGDNKKQEKLGFKYAEEWHKEA